MHSVSNPHTTSSESTNLSSVSIVLATEKPDYIKAWTDVCKERVATIQYDKEISGISDIKRKKIAVILDQDVPVKIREEIALKYESMCEGESEMCQKIFYLFWDLNSGDGVHKNWRIVYLRDMTPNHFPTSINRALYKTRLPDFLLENFDVEIKDVLEMHNGINYRPITIRSYVTRGGTLERSEDSDTYETRGGTRELDYITQNLYIHDRKLFTLSDILDADGNKTMREVSEDGMVSVNKIGSKLGSGSVYLSKLKDDTEED